MQLAYEEASEHSHCKDIYCIASDQS